MTEEKQIEEKHELSESIYMSGHGLDWKDCDDIAEQLYHAGYRKQSEIIRCRDCRHWYASEDGRIHNCRIAHGLNGIVEGDYFCSYARRK